MKILIVGHACAPGLGSEPGFTWNWAWQMSRFHEVWVITHPEYKDRVDSFVASNPNDRVHFVWVVPKSRFDYWTPGSNQERGIRLHYWLWVREAYRQAASLNEQVHFDLVHHVSLSTIALPPPFWKLPVPAVWGPIGGGQSFPPAFISQLRTNRIKEFVRSLNLLLLPFSPTLRRSVASAHTVLATNLETRSLLERAGASRVGLFLDCGVDGPLTPPGPRVAGQQLTLLWAGRLEPQKGLLIALRAMAVTKSRDSRLLVAGAGAEQVKMEALARSLGLTDRVEFLGRVPHETMEAYFQSCDALVFTSLRDSFGSVVLEAMSNGLPVIALNHQGMRAFVPDDASIKVPVHSPDQVITDLANAFDVLASNPELQRTMSKAALAFAENQTWRRRAETMNELYAETVKGTAAHAVPAHQPAGTFDAVADDADGKNASSSMRAR
jgi:glycosyltransferase involved in cell wall biosynthesis